MRPFHSVRYYGLLTGFCALLPGCNHSNPAQIETPVYPPRESEAALIEFLARTYVRKDIDAFATVFHPDYQYWPSTPLDDGTNSWGLQDELGLHRYWFGLDSIPPLTPSLGSRTQSRQFPFEFTSRGEFSEPVIYPVGEGPDPARWRVTEAAYRGHALLGSSGDTDFLVVFRWEFVVLCDRMAVPGDPNRYLLYRWLDLGSLAFQEPAFQPGRCRKVIAPERVGPPRP